MSIRIFPKVFQTSLRTTAHGVFLFACGKLDVGHLISSRTNNSFNNSWMSCVTKTSHLPKNDQRELKMMTFPLKWLAVDMKDNKVATEAFNAEAP